LIPSSFKLSRRATELAFDFVFEFFFDFLFFAIFKVQLKNKNQKKDGDPIDVWCTNHLSKGFALRCCVAVVANSSDVAL
jgi:hypothetical protein